MTSRKTGENSHNEAHRLAVPNQFTPRPLNEQIIERQETAKWGDGFLQQMSKDLSHEFPEIKGFSYRNLRRMRQWYTFWASTDAIGPQAVAKTESSQKSTMQQLVAQIPWGHNSVLLEKLSNPSDALFYVLKTIENNWSRAVLKHQIESGLHLREGKAIDNFEATLPKPKSDLARRLCALCASVFQINSRSLSHGI